MTLSNKTKSDIESLTGKVKEPRVLNLDNTLNLDTLRNSRTEEDGEIVKCPVTDKDLYYITKAGYMRALEPNGECWCCGKIFHLSAMHTVKGTDPTTAPTSFVGMLCLTCFDLDDIPFNKILESRGIDYRLPSFNV